MERAGWNYPPGDLRVSDADRDRALSELSGAFQAGRITAGEFDERSGQALGARTGKQLVALLADLPAEPVEQAPAAGTEMERAHRLVATRIVIGVCALAATGYALAAAGAALDTGTTLQQREFMQQMMARQGVQVSQGSLSGSGFDWVGTVVPGTFAVLLVVLIVHLCTRLARAKRA